MLGRVLDCSPWEQFQLLQQEQREQLPRQNLDSIQESDLILATSMRISIITSSDQQNSRDLVQTALSPRTAISVFVSVASSSVEENNLCLIWKKPAYGRLFCFTGFKPAQQL